MQEVSTLLGKTPEEVRQMGEGLKSQAQNKLYVEKNVDNGVISLKKDDTISQLDDADVPNINDTKTPEPSIINRFKQMIDDRSKE